MKKLCDLAALATIKWQRLRIKFVDGVRAVPRFTGNLLMQGVHLTVGIVMAGIVGTALLAMGAAMFVYNQTSPGTKAVTDKILDTAAAAIERLSEGAENLFKRGDE